MQWDEVIKRERLAERLHRLPKSRVVSFAGGCAAHVLERFQEEPELGTAAFVTVIADAFKDFWSGFPIHAEAARRQVLLLQPLIPDDDAGDEDALVPGRYDLVMATIYACECAEKPDAQKALDTAAHAYQAIYDLELRPNEISRAEPELDAAERDSTACQNEIEFQLSYIAALEQLPLNATVDFATVCEVLRR